MAYIGNSTDNPSYSKSEVDAIAAAQDELSELKDVTITDNTDGQLLRWDGNKFVNNTLSEASLDSSAEVTAKIIAEVDDLSGVSNASGARTNIGVAIGFDVEAYDETILRESDIGGKISSDLVLTPTITSPTSGVIDYIGEITSSEYITTQTWSKPHDYTKWELSFTSDFAVIEEESTVGNLTSWTPAPGVALQECFVRVQYGSDGHRSGNSESISFTTPNIFIEEPTLTVAGAPLDIAEKPLLSTNAFSVFTGTDTHASTDWRVTKVSDSSVVFESLANTVDLLSISVPSGLLEVSTAYTFEARHTGTTFGSSAFASVAGTTAAQFTYENYLAVAHTGSPYITIYGNDVDTIIKLDDPTGELPTGVGKGVAFSADGNYMAVAHYTTPYITIYKRDGDVFNKLANPDVIPPANSEGVAFSADGTYMAVAHSTTPYISTYKRSGDTFNKLTNPAELPPNTGNGVAFSADGNYMAVAHASTPFITIYKITAGDTFNKLAEPADLPVSTGNAVAFSPDGTYMAVAHSGSAPFIIIYKRSGDAFAKLPDPAELPASTARGVAFSPDGTYMTVAHFQSPFITIYKRDGDAFNKLPNPSLLPSSTCYGVAFSADGADGSYMAVAHPVTPFITRYKRSGDVFTKLADPTSLPAVSGADLGVAYYPGAFFPALVRKEEV